MEANSGGVEFVAELRSGPSATPGCYIREMPIHDWTQVTANAFHSFHGNWITMLQASLNGGLLPPGYYAEGEQVTATQISPDMLTLVDEEVAVTGRGEEGGLAVADAPPKLAVHETLTDEEVLAGRRRRVVVRHNSGDHTVAVIEVVSRGNKSKRAAADQFVGKACELLAAEVHLVVLDLYPPGAFDPDGMHGRIWESLGGSFAQPASNPLTLAAYVAHGPIECYVEPTRVGAPLIEVPLFLSRGRYVNLPLEQTYLSAYQIVPAKWKRVLEAAS